VGALSGVGGSIQYAFKGQELCPFTRTLLRAPLVYSNFDLNSTSYTIVEIKT